MPSKKKEKILNKKKGTQTSSFGSSGRESHNSSVFYSSKLYKNLPNEIQANYMENLISPDFLNQIICKSSVNMEELPKECIHLMITSPPYGVGKEYDENFTLQEYLEFLRGVWLEVRRVLVNSGRACINIANLGRKPYIPLHSHIIKDMVDLGFLMRGEIIWDKSASAGTSTAWGSWQSASNPVLRDVHEYILVFSKSKYKRAKIEGRKSTISREEFLDFTKSIWRFPTVSARKIGHPAPFPEELPRRLIELYSFKGDIILDPFIGSGSTALAALKSNRYFIGYEISSDYVELANKRISNFLNQKKIDNFF